MSPKSVYARVQEVFSPESGDLTFSARRTSRERHGGKFTCPIPQMGEARVRPPEESLDGPEFT